MLWKTTALYDIRNRNVTQNSILRTYADKLFSKKPENPDEDDYLAQHVIRRCCGMGLYSSAQYIQDP